MQMKLRYDDVEGCEGMQMKQRYWQDRADCGIKVTDAEKCLPDCGKRSWAVVKWRLAHFRIGLKSEPRGNLLEPCRVKITHADLRVSAHRNRTSIVRTRSR